MHSREVRLTWRAKLASLRMVCDVRSQGKPIARRSAQKIVEALDREFQTQGAKAPLVMGRIHGLLIKGQWHKKPTQKWSVKPLTLWNHLHVT